jgi:membrane protein
MSTRSASLGSGHARGDRQRAEIARHGSGDELKEDAGKAKTLAMRAFHKFINDWSMNLTAMVSYNLLTSFFPLVLALITILALLPAVSNNTSHFASQINSVLPSEVGKSIDIASLLNSVNKEGGILGLVSIVGLLWGGTNLFGSIESAFAVIFRVKTRDFVAQKLMSLVMILLFVVLLPLSFISSLLLGSATTSLGTIMPGGASGPVGLILGLATSLAALFVLFLAIYIVVPNIPISWRHAWRGALVAAVVMWVINTLFPYYTAHFVGTKQYGAAAIGSAIVTITWFWFFSLVLLVGAQVNALAMDLGPWPYDLPGVLMRYKTPPTEGKRTGMDAARDEESPRERNSPFGVARDAQKVEDPTRGRSAGGAEAAAAARGGRADSAGKKTDAPNTKRDRNDKSADTRRPVPLPIRDNAATPRVSATKEPRSAASTYAVDPKILRGILVIGGSFGLLRGILQSFGKRQHRR